MQHFGELLRQPANHFVPGLLGNAATVHRIVRDRNGLFLQPGIDDAQQSAAVPVAVWMALAQHLQHVLQRPTWDILHVQQSEAPVGQHALVIDADDIGVIQASQRLRFAASIGRYFDGHNALHRHLSSEKHRGKSAFAQSRQKFKVIDLIARPNFDRGAIMA